MSLEHIGDMPNLVSIEDNAFAYAYGYNSESGTSTWLYCTSLKSIGDTPKLKKIGSSSFSNCTALESIGDLRSVTEIGNYAFDACSNLTLRVLPNSYAENYAKSNKIPYTYIED